MGTLLSVECVSLVLQCSRGKEPVRGQVGQGAQGSMARVAPLHPRLRPGKGAGAGGTEEQASTGAMTGGRGRHRASLQPMVCSVGQRNVCAG